MIPGCGEFSLDPNYSYLNKAFPSLLELKESLPHVKWIAPVVGWFANSLILGECKIKPGYDKNYRCPTNWQVSTYTFPSLEEQNEDADHKPYQICQVENNSIYGGSISDDSVLKYLEYAHSLGLKIIFYPIIMLNQITKPWRGWIGKKGGESKAEDIESFYETQYEPFILHYANLTKGKIDAFIIGSELIGLTTLHTANNEFPFVKKLIGLARLVKQILGSNVQVTYAADWSEYHTADDNLRPLDELWASEDIDFVGIDAYFPLTYSKKSYFTLEQLTKGWESGEGYDFYFNNNGEKVEYSKQEPWNMWKNLSYWWNSEHWVWNQEKQESFKTPWKPKMKPIWFTEFGFPSIDKAPNKPNVFFNPECEDGNIPTFSNGKIDNAAQILALRATLEYWQNSEFLENLICWTWDARGVGWHNLEYFSDGILWHYGHWIDGKLPSPKFKVILSGNLVVENELLFDAKIVIISAIAQAPNLNLDVDRALFKNSQLFIAQLLLVNSPDELFEITDTLVHVGVFVIKAKSLIWNSSVIEAGEIKGTIAGDFHVVPKKWSDHKEESHGSKSKISIDIEYITTPVIQASLLDLEIEGTWIVEHAKLIIENLFVKAKNIDFKTIVTTYKLVDEFRGKKDCATPERQESTEIKIAQSANRVEIFGISAVIEVDNIFKAQGTRIALSDFKTEAKDFQFSGVVLDHSVTINGKTKGGFFKPSKKYSSEDSHQSIEGVEIFIDNKGYIIAEGKIWMQGAKVNAKELNVKAKEVSLDSMIGGNFHNMRVLKSGLYLALNCSEGEVSVGIEKIHDEKAITHFSQYLFPSIFNAEILNIETEKLSQHGSVISGGKGNIKAKNWRSTAPELISTTEMEHTRASIGLKLGIQENVSRAVRGIANTAQNIGSGGHFGAINTVSNLYGNFKDITGLLSGQIIGVASPISTNVSSSHFSQTQITYGMSLASFEDLDVEITEDISGELEIRSEIKKIKAKDIKLDKPQDEIHTESSNTGFSINTSGFSVNHYQEKDGKGLGLGVNMGFDNKDTAFGNDYRLLYSNGEDRLDVTFTPLDSERLMQNLNNGTLFSRVADNISQTGEKLLGQIENLQPDNNDIEDHKIEIFENISDTGQKQNVPSKHLLPLVKEDQVDNMHISHPISGNEYNSNNEHKGSKVKNKTKTSSLSLDPISDIEERLDMDICKISKPYIPKKHEEVLTTGKFKNLAQHCIIEFVQYTKNSVANEKIQENFSF